MKKLFFIAALLTLTAAASVAQQRSNDEITREIKRLGVPKIDVTYDAASKTSKIMAVSENFSNSDANAAGVLAMNFAMGLFYPGEAITTTPQSIHLTFWVLTKKPRFAENHHFTVDLDGRTIDLGDARYAAKPNQNMEYLNFDIPLTDLKAIGAGRDVLFKIGGRRFDPAQSQLKLIRAISGVVDLSSGR